MAKTITGDSPRREQRIQQLLLGRIEQRQQRRMAAEIRRAMTEAADAIEQGNVASIQGTHRNRTRAILTELWTQGATLLAERILGQQQRSQHGPWHIKRAEVSPTQVMDGAMREWIAAYGTQKITQITDTTQSDVQLILRTGVAEGMSEREIGKLIKSVAATKSASRAQTIARTEVHAAANASAQASAELTGLDMMREWVASDGERTREDHRQADGQVVGMNEPFTVGGYALQYPGDPSGPAEQVINCRCVIAYIPQV